MSVPGARHAAAVDDADGHRQVSWPKVTALSLCCATAIAVFVSGMHMLDVHRFYGVWAWSPPAHTVSIKYHGRMYVQPHPATEQDLVGCHRVGTAPGDGQILAAATPLADTVPIVVFVRYPDQTIVAYDLSGGP